MSFNSTATELIEQNINGLLSIHESWERIPVEFIAKIINGFAFKSSAFNSDENGAPLIRIRDVLKGKTGTYYSGEIPDGYWVKTGDLIVGMDGDFNTTIWRSDHALLNQRVCKIQITHEEYDERFFFHSLPGYLSAINANTSSVTVKHLSSKTLQETLFPLPPIAEQKIIAEKLDTLLAQIDSTKARLEQIPKILKRFRQAVLVAAVSGKLTDEWRKKFCIPHGQLQPLNVAGSIIAGQSPSSSQVNNQGKGIAYVTGPEQWDGKKILPHKWTEYPKKIAPDGSIFVTVKGAGVGKTFPGCKCAIGRDVYAFVPNSEMNYKYILFSIQAAAADVVVKAKGLIPGLTKANIIEHVVYIPDIREQHEIVRRVEQLFAYADTIEKQVNFALSRVNHLTQSILAKAFRGELTAQWREENPDLISGENSAAALLEKIKAECAASGGKKASRKKA
ncbi:restriction endonuclease subunit S [Pectobacterium actinidiae]|uniref:restriction endonuclease subunit S n=1 Tax=Pectobacterium actinidiae TaxID=1507808 RepID=UPI00404077C9